MISKATITPIYITITKLEIQIATFNFDTQLSRYLRRSSTYEAGCYFVNHGPGSGLLGDRFFLSAGRFLHFGRTTMGLPDEGAHALNWRHIFRPG